MSDLKIQPVNGVSVKESVIERETDRDTPKSKLNRRSTLQTFEDGVKRYGSLSHLSLYTGATLSFIDIIFDILMIQEYYETKQTAFANATICCIVVSLLFQFILVLVQNR
ncbi:hypothetical protein TrLO_g7312 [Triparma laevis f. longispina]|uniref:Uncharacterized protein n=1 Tax=Triparma laevis f. longispina TaxID=1714387 RepID=A0A9W6ZEE8_9STRA|nr:hypothetical protein TrLO_g7312 [Triparma laevis f. longispina]